MSLLPSATYSAPGVPLYGPGGGGGGGGGAGNFSTSVTTGPNATSTSLIAIYGDATDYLQISSDINKSAIGHRSSNVIDSGQLIFGSGNMILADNTGQSMMTFSTLSRGVDMGTGINMNNTTIALDSAKAAGLYYNAGDNNVYLTGISTHVVNIGTQANAVQMAVQDGQVSIQGNLQVSTVNGIVYPSGPVVTSLGLSNFTGNSAVIPQGNLAYPLSAFYNVTGNHTYRISQNITASNGDPAATYTTFAVSGGGLAGLPVFLRTFQNSTLVPSQAGGASGIQTIFKASANGQIQIVGYNNSAASNTTIEVQPDGAGGGVKWIVEDLGVGLT